MSSKNFEILPANNHCVSQILCDFKCFFFSILWTSTQTGVIFYILKIYEIIIIYKVCFPLKESQ